MINLSDIPKFVVSLPRREDRRVKVSRELSKHGIDFKFWDAVDKDTLAIPITSSKLLEFNSKGIYACLLSHLNLIKHCKDEGYEMVVVFEDDVALADDFNERVEMIDVEFDMFYLGGHYQYDKDVQQVHNYIYKVNSMAGTYAYILCRTGFDFIINNISYNYGMDEFYDKVFIKKFNAFTFLPMMVDHIDEMSDVVGRKVSYPLTHKYFRKRL